MWVKITEKLGQRLYRQIFYRKQLLKVEFLLKLPLQYSLMNLLKKSLRSTHKMDLMDQANLKECWKN